MTQHGEQTNGGQANDGTSEGANDATSEDANGGGAPEQSVIVVGPAGMAVSGPDGSPEGEGRSLTDLVDQPAKVMRIGSMIKQLLEEVRGSSLDEASRARLREIHTRSIKELEEGLAPELVSELERISLPFTDDEVPSEAELRVAQAQLVGWLEGLFHGIQTALFAQQMAARAQLEEMRRRALPAGMELPPGASYGPGGPGGAGGSGGDGQGADSPSPGGTGQYL